MTHEQADVDTRKDIDAQVIALRALVALLLVGAAWQLAGLLVPFVLAVVLAIAFSPVVNRLERIGVPGVLSSLLCVLFVAGVLTGTAGLILVQAGTILQDSDKYFDRFSQLLAAAARKTGSNQALESLNVLESDEPAARSPGPSGSDRGDDPSQRPDRRKSDASSGQGRGGGGSGGGDDVAMWNRLLRRSAQAAGRWIISGLGGMIGALGGVVVFLAYLFYLLHTRDEWVERITDALERLGLEPRPGLLEKVQGEVVTYLGYLSIVALGYAITVGLILWALGIPQPLLWGALAGLLEFVPYFGPLIASILPTIVALSLGTWWQPVAVVAQYLGLHLVEGYVVTPQLYSRVIRLNPVTILFGALFFGWIWGPVGLALAMPMMIILRGLLVITPDVPALDALAGVEEMKDHGDSPEPTLSAGDRSSHRADDPE